MGIKCEYHLVPSTDGGLANEPALTARGFAELMQFFSQAHPDVEAARLNHVVEELPVEAKFHKDGQLQRLPKQLSRHLFPSQPNEALGKTIQKHLQGSSSPSSSPLGPLGDAHVSRAASHRLNPFYDPNGDPWKFPRDTRAAYQQHYRPYQAHPAGDREASRYWSTRWSSSRPDRFDISSRYLPSTYSSTSSSSDSDSSPQSPKSPTRPRCYRREHERSRSPSPPRRHRRNSSPPCRTHLPSRPRCHSDAAPPSRRSSGGFLATLSDALTLHPRHAERYSGERREDRRERGRRRSYESSASDEPRRREYVYYFDGRGSRRSDEDLAPRSARAGSRVENAPRRRRERSRDVHAPRW